MNLTEKVIESKEVYKGDFLKVERVEVTLPDNNKAFRDIVRHPGAAAILAFLDDETIILEKQFRMAVNSTILEIPAGKLHKGEDPKEAAKRELEEETGYKADRIEKIGEILVGPGFTDEKIYIYKASHLSKGVKSCDADEFVELYPIKIKDIKKYIKEGKITDAKTIASLMYLG